MERHSRTRLTVSELLVLVVIAALLLMVVREMTRSALKTHSIPGAGSPQPPPRPPFRLLRLDVRARCNTSMLEASNEARFSQFPG